MHALSAVCCDQNVDSEEQSREIIRLIKEGANIQATDKNGVTALHHAVRFRRPIAVATLLKQGAKVNQACNRSGATPLHRAVTSTGAPGTAGKGQEACEIVALLLKHGADPLIKNKQGKVPVDYVSDVKLKELLRTTNANASRS